MKIEDNETILQRMVRKRNEGGFTLIELLIVIIILAILAAIVVFAVGNTGTNAAAASCESDAKTVETALETYDAEIGNYPAADAWASLTGTTVQAGTTYGPFLRAQPSTAHYAINFNAAGKVSADAAGAGAYSGTDDIDGANGAAGPCNTHAH